MIPRQSALATLSAFKQNRPQNPHPQQYRQALGRANNILEGRSEERHRPCHETSGRLHRQAESTKQVQSASAIDSPPHITSPSNIPCADAGGHQTSLLTEGYRAGGKAQPLGKRERAETPLHRCGVIINTATLLRGNLTIQTRKTYQHDYNASLKILLRGLPSAGKTTI